MRLLPNPNKLTVIANGRTYSGTVDTAMVVSVDADAAILTANGWAQVDPAAALSGDLTDYATAAQGTKADTATQPLTTTQVAALTTVDLSVLTTVQTEFLTTAQIGALQTTLNECVTLLKTR